MHILLTGGTGRLGRAIQAAFVQGAGSLMAPPRTVLDVTNEVECFAVVHQLAPTIVIHCAAYTNSLVAETTKRNYCWKVNVEGTRNMVRAARGRRFVLISTDYVFSGRDCPAGGYREDSKAEPVNHYGLTKLAAEWEVRTAPATGNHLILRAPFRVRPWPYRKAFQDQYTSCIWAEERAQQILRMALREDVVGLWHMGGERRSIFEMARSARPDVNPISIRELDGLELPADTTLNDNLWRSLSEA